MVSGPKSCRKFVGRHFITEWTMQAGKIHAANMPRIKMTGWMTGWVESLKNSSRQCDHRASQGNCGSRNGGEAAAAASPPRGRHGHAVGLSTEPLGGVPGGGSSLPASRGFVASALLAPSLLRQCLPPHGPSEGTLFPQFSRRTGAAGQHFPKKSY